MDIADFATKAVYKVELSGGQRRLKEAILYVCKKSNEMERFGAIKLNKILWRADFRAYYDRQIPVTGRQYQRIALGPAPVEMPPLINELLRDELLEIKPTDVGGFMEKRHIALADPVTNLFSREDLDYLDEAINHYWRMTGTETSDESHGIAWRTRENGDPMPYQTSFFEDAPLSNDHLRRLARLGRERGWTSN